MKPSSYTAISHEKLSSASPTDVKTASVPKGTSAILLTVETNPVRITFDGTDPTASNTGLVVQQNQNPWFLPMGPSTNLKVVSTTGAAIAQLAYIQ